MFRTLHRNTQFRQTVERLAARFQPKPSRIYSRSKFNLRTQAHGENCLQFITALRALAVNCGYPDTINDELIRDRFVVGCSDLKIRERMLLDKDDLTLEQALTLAQTVERATTESATVSKQSDHSASVQALSHRSPKRSGSRFKNSNRSPSPAPRHNTNSYNNNKSSSSRCGWCGGDRHPREQCPASGKTCSKCNRMGHFASVCKSTARSPHHQSRASSRSSNGRLSTIHAVTAEGDSQFKFVDLIISGKSTTLLADLGAKVSILNSKFIRSLHDKPQYSFSKIKLSTYTGSPVRIRGLVHLSVKLRSKIIPSFPFYVVEEGDNLMGVDLFDALGFKVTSPEIGILASIESKHPVLQQFPSLVKSDPTKSIRHFSHQPNLNPNILPVAQKMRRLPLALNEEVCKELNRMEADGVLEKIDSSPWVSNLVVVRKPNGQIRLCCDLTAVNKAVIPDQYPLPTVDELSKFFSGATVFSKIDLKWGYLQVNLAPESRYLTAMITPTGLYQWKRLPFCLCSAPSCFQKLIEKILEGCEGVRNLLDDIIICGRNRAEHDARLRKVLQRLSDYCATINTEKCTFNVTEIDFAGHTVSKHGVKPLLSNVKDLLAVTEPTSIKELQSFLGAANYYRKFVRNFAEIADPLHKLLQKDTAWNFDSQCRSSFEQIKREISSERVLAHFNPSAQTLVSTDASGVALGAVLSQIIQGQERPVAFASRALSPAERGYSASEREALACIWACEHWHYYLYGRKFTLRTDHSALTTLLSGSNKGRKPMRLLRWADRLQQYSYEIVYRSGKENTVPDLLSRAVDSGYLLSNTSEAHPDQTLELQTISTIFGSLALKAITPNELGQETQSDPLLKQVFQYVQSGWPHKKPEDELKSYYTIREELTCAKDCIYRELRAVVPKSLRSRVLQLAHEGHPGIVRTKQRLRDSVWWPNIDRDAEDHVRSCNACVLADKSTKPAIPPLKPIQFPARPWQRLSLDIVGELHGAPSNFKFLLVLIDHHSKWPEVKPVTTITTHSVIEFLSELFCRWGLPEEIITDNGRQFISREFEDFLSSLAIKHCRTALYHPQSNGAVERFNRVLKEGLRTAKATGRSFEQSLRSVLLTYRSTPQATTGVSPAELLIGRQLRTPLDTLLLQKPPRRITFDIPERVEEKQKQSKQYYDRTHHTKPSNFQTGNFVRIRKPVRKNKLEPAYTDPMRVTGRPSNDTARFEDGSTWNAADLIPALNPAPGPNMPQLERDEAVDPAPPRTIQPAEPPQLRRSTRERHPPKRFADYTNPDDIDD